MSNLESEIGSRVLDLRSKIEKLKSKAYRDAYMQGHVRAGIGYQIRALREQRGLTQSELAELVDTKQSVISRIENISYGKVSIQTLLDIASKLDIALTVRFSSYPSFLKNIDDVSPQALRVDSFEESRWDTLPSPEPLEVVVPAAENLPAQIAAAGMVPAVVVKNTTGVFLCLMLQSNSNPTTSAAVTTGKSTQTLSGSGWDRSTSL